MGADARHGHDSAVEADGRRSGRVPWGAAGGDPGDCRGREPRGGGDANRGGQEHVVHVAGMGGARGNDGRGGAVDCITGRHDAAVQRGGDCVCRVGKSTAARRSGGGVGDARVGSGSVVCDVFEPAAGNETVGPDRD